jgi:MarR family transcriptional regulator, organic hydroperoxide resistance regulator
MSSPAATPKRRVGRAKPAERADGAAAEPARSDRGEGEREVLLDDLGAAFKRTFRTLSRLRGRDTHLAGQELSHAQFELLIQLHERGELSVGELATAARLAPATVTQMLDHLASSGHVERVRSENDRRVVVSRLTLQGASQIEAKHAAWQSRWKQAMAGIGVEELRGATVVLERLAEMFEQGPTDTVCEASGTAAQAPAEAGGKPS